MPRRVLHVRIGVAFERWVEVWRRHGQSKLAGAAALRAQLLELGGGGLGAEYQEPM